MKLLQIFLILGCFGIALSVPTKKESLDVVVKDNTARDKRSPQFFGSHGHGRHGHGGMGHMGMGGGGMQGFRESQSDAFMEGEMDGYRRGQQEGMMQGERLGILEGEILELERELQQERFGGFGGNMFGYN